MRVDELLYDAAKLVSGLVPTRKQVDAESRADAEREGRRRGRSGHLPVACARAMPRPACICVTRCCGRRWNRSSDATNSSLTASIDFGPARVERQGKAAIVTMQNPRFLNAEDDDTLDDTETAADIAILDPMSEICVLRGGTGRSSEIQRPQVFCRRHQSDPHLHGKIPFLWYIRRDMGVVNKMFRGLAIGPARPRRDAWRHASKSPGSRGVDIFAIGGGCQYLLAMDYVVAGSDAYMTLPARKEGIIPGAANLRLTRFVGARMARQAILMGRRFDCDSPEGRMICDEVVRPAEMEQSARPRRSMISPDLASSAPPATGAPSASARSRSTCSAAIWRSIAASRLIAISRRR